MLLLGCSRGATQSTSSTISQPGLKFVLVEFVKPEANPNNNLMMRRVGLSNLPGIVLWFLFAYLVDSGCSWHFDLLWMCSLNSIYQSQIVVSLVRNLQKNVPLWGKQKLPKVHLKQFYCLVHWYDLQGSWRRQIPLKLSINMRRSIVLANTRLRITYVDNTFETLTEAKADPGMFSKIQFVSLWSAFAQYERWSFEEEEII